MKLKEARCTFSRFVPKLLDKMQALGYECAIDFVKRCSGCGVGKKNSNHKSGLAVDIHLYKNGDYQASTDAHREAGWYWESLHPWCRWGGRFNDGNHYEFVIGGWRK